MSDLPAATGGAGIIPAQYSQQQIQLIRDMCARDCTDNEFLLLIGLDGEARFGDRQLGCIAVAPVGVE